MMESPSARAGGPWVANAGLSIQEQKNRPKGRFFHWKLWAQQNPFGSFVLSGCTLAQTVDNVIARIMLAQKLMARLRAEMRNIHYCGGITGQKTQNCPLGQCSKHLARPQDGKGA